MDKNNEFLQIIISESRKDYDKLKGKVVDKIAFTNRGYEDEQMFIITFTDKTFICIGIGHRDIDGSEMDPELQNNHITYPQCINGGDYSCHMWLGDDGNLKFDQWIQILIDLGIWDLSTEEAQEIIKKKEAEKEQREYELYLKLKDKFEKK